MKGSKRVLIIFFCVFSIHLGHVPIDDYTADKDIYRFSNHQSAIFVVPHRSNLFCGLACLRGLPSFSLVCVYIADKDIYRVSMLEASIFRGV
jgi:hypothetical protein